MKKVLLAGVLCIVVLTSMIAKKSVSSVKANPGSGNVANVTAAVSVEAEINYLIDSLYTGMQLNEAGLSRSVFYDAYKGYQYMLAQNKLTKQGLLTICDYSQSSNKKRLYVLNLNRAEVLFNTYVSHGRNSGNEFATRFSNSNNSHKSSLGFMRTAETYNGDNGYSMRLDGMENGFNSNVRTRAIVMHGSNYVNGQRAVTGTMMGRSYGCPAVPASEVREIINTIKNGSCFFTYYPDKFYTKASKILNADFVWPVTEALQLAAIKIPDSLKKAIAPAENPDQLF